ncbi:MAG: GNAT family N-acetyltransferase [Candidatus Riflebacteria bacterium]|nr:GNAT family N-acetyltransferase [Candidatus Riflebacteria bacterium]
MSDYRFMCPDAQDWGILRQIADIDAQAFGTDGISVFNLSQFTRSGSVFCLIDDKNKVVAETVLLRNIHDDGAVVFGFAVDETRHGQGLGAILMRYLVRLAIDSGLAWLELTVNPNNLAAMKLYMEKSGFYKMAELSDHPQKMEPRWLLRLDLHHAKSSQ